MRITSEPYEYFRCGPDPASNRGIRDGRIFYMRFVGHINFNTDTSILPTPTAAAVRAPACTRDVPMLNIYPPSLDAMAVD